MEPSNESSSRSSSSHLFAEEDGTTALMTPNIMEPSGGGGDGESSSDEAQHQQQHPSSSGSGGDDEDKKQQVYATAKRDNLAIRRSKVMFFSFLALAAAGIGLAVYFLLSHQEEETFKAEVCMVYGCMHVCMMMNRACNCCCS